MRIFERGLVAAAIGLSFCGCQEQAEPTVSSDGMGGSGEETPVGASTSVACESNSECDDGAFCNGVEQCVDGFCHLGVAPNCDDGIDCTEDSCSHSSNSCLFVAPDADGDGHADASCAGPNGESLGDDCDDEDANRYPGNTESCTLDDPTHDEDCNPNTFGHLDQDEDGAISAECCNASDDGDICGDDCDDESFRRYPEHPEICDEIDNDCDGEVDVNTKEVLWYPDEDGDQYGGIDAEGVLDCSPVEGHALRATDCNDSTAAVHSAALEICDGVDNDCDGDIDEEGVCACAPEGNARACACQDGNTGVQSCTGGLWGSCDCTECETGAVDCLGDLLPRTCVDGRWVVGSACTGIRPICLEGACVCSDGSDDCVEIEDFVSPVILASSPVNSQSDFPRDGVLAAVFSEDLMSATVSELSVTLWDALGNPIPGEVNFGGSSITFRPDDPLPPGFDFEWRLEGGISDIAGNTMGGRQRIEFSTEPEVIVTALGDPPNVTYDQARLAVSPNGNAKMSAMRTDGTGGDLFVVVGTVELDFNGASWVDTGMIYGDTDLPSAITVDDQDWAVATRRLGSAVFRYDLQGAGWLWEETPVSATDSSPEPLLVGNGVGDVLIGTPYEGEMRATMRSPVGTYSSVDTVGVPDGLAFDDPLYLVGDVSENREAVMVWDQGDSLLAWRTTGPMASWTQAANVDGSLDAIESASVAMGEDGVATVAWIQFLDDGGGPRYTQVQVQDLDASASWLEAPEFAEGQWKPAHETDVHVGKDAAGNTHLIYVENSTVLWMGREPGMSWSPPGAISLNHVGVNHLELKVSANGTAYAMWLDGFDLWAARFNPGLGWEPPQRIEDINSRITEAQIEVDGSGNAHVIFFAQEWYALELFAPTL